MTRMVVIGGGPVGLATATLLARGGLEVILLERHKVVGGRTAPLSSRKHSFDPSPWFLSPEAYEDFFALVERRMDDYLDLIEPDLRFRAFFEKGLDSPAEILDLNADAQTNWGLLEEVHAGDGEAARRLILKAARENQLIRERLEFSPSSGVLSPLRPTSVRHLTWFARRLLRSLGGVVARKIHHPHIRRLLEFPSLNLTGSPMTTPAAYTPLCYHHLGGAVRHPRGGFGAVIAALEQIAQEEGVDIRTENDVARILVDPESRLAGGVVLRTGEVIPADLIVSCVDLHHTETSLLPEEFSFYPESSWGRIKASPSALIVTVGVKKRLPQLAHHNLFFPQNWKRLLSRLESTPVDDPFASEFLYVGRPTATDRSMAPKGKESLILITPLPPDPSLGGTDESRHALEDLATQLLAQVGTLAGIPDLTERSQVFEIVTPADLVREHSAWRGSVFGLAPTLRGVALRHPRDTSRRVRNLLYAGSSMLPGVGIPGAFASAEVVAKSLLGQKDPAPLLAPIERGFLHATRRTDVLGELLKAPTAEESP